MSQTVVDLDAPGARPAAGRGIPTDKPRRSQWPEFSWPRVLLEGVAVSLLTLAVAAWALKLWRGDLSVPLRYQPVDDTKFYLMLVKGIIDHGWFLTNHTLGAPFGQQIYDYPQGGDNLNFLIIRFFALFSSSPALVANLFYLSTYVLAAFTAHVVLRRLGVSTLSAALGAVLFTLLPYHFFRGESHMLLAAYYSIPLAAYLFLSLVGNRDLFRKRPTGARTLRWLSPLSLGTIAICVIVGSTSVYYAAMAEVLLLGGTIVAAVLRRPTRQVVTGAALIVLIAATLAANLAPSLVYNLEHGRNSQVVRSALDDESHGLKLTNLVLPNPNDRIAPLRHVAEHYNNQVAPTYCEACYGSLGTVGTAGLIWLALCGLGTLLGAAGWFGSRRLFRHSAFAIATALVVASVGGISSLIEFFITPDLRGWNRISVFIAFFCFLAVGLLLDRLREAGDSRRHGTPLVLTGTVALLAFGIYDQTSDYFVPTYAANAREYRSDAAFVTRIQKLLPHSASVYEMPYVPFPEGYPYNSLNQNATSYASSYELTRGYLHSTTLNWSYGAMKGRPADWSSQLAAKPLGLALPAIVAAGFDGLWVDPQGYPQDNGRQIESALQTLLAQKPLTSRAGDLWFFDLRPYRAQLQRTHGASQINALRATGLAPLGTSCATGRISISNPTAKTQNASLSLSVANGTALTLRYPSGQTVTAKAAPDGTIVLRNVTVPPGASTIRLSGAAGEQLTRSTLIDASYQPFASGARQPASQTPVGIVPPPCLVS